MEVLYLHPLYAIHDGLFPSSLIYFHFVTEMRLLLSE